MWTSAPAQRYRSQIMARRIRDANGLTLQEHQYCQHRARGLSQRRAYLKAWPKCRAKADTVDNKASKLEARDGITARIIEIQRSLTVSDLDSPGRAFSDLLDMIEDARAAKNHTAVSSLQRLRMDGMGMLKSGGIGSSERLFSDENLLEKLAGANLELKQALARLLGADDFATTKRIEPKKATHDGADTKH